MWRWVQHGHEWSYACHEDVSWLARFGLRPMVRKDQASCFPCPPARARLRMPQHLVASHEQPPDSTVALFLQNPRLPAPLSLRGPIVGGGGATPASDFH